MSYKVAFLGLRVRELLPYRHASRCAIHGRCVQIEREKESNDRFELRNADLNIKICQNMSNSWDEFLGRSLDYPFEECCNSLIGQCVKRTKITDTEGRRGVRQCVSSM